MKHYDGVFSCTTVEHYGQSEYLVLEDMEVHPDTLKFWDRWIEELTAGIVNKYYDWFDEYQTKYLFVDSLPFIIGDIWRLNSAKDLLECYGYPTEQPSDKLEEVFEKFYADCRSLEGRLPAWYTLDGVTAWIDDYRAPQPYDYEEE